MKRFFLMLSVFVFLSRAIFSSYIQSPAFDSYKKDSNNIGIGQNIGQVESYGLGDSRENTLENNTFKYLGISGIPRSVVDYEIVGRVSGVSSGVSGEMVNTSLSHRSSKERLFEAVDNLKTNKKILIGFSRGAMIALDFFCDHPESVDAVVLAAPPISFLRVRLKVAEVYSDLEYRMQGLTDKEKETPIALIHDFNDPIVPYDHSRSIANALLRAGFKNLYFVPLQYDGVENKHFSPIQSQQVKIFLDNFYMYYGLKQASITMKAKAMSIISKFHVTSNNSIEDIEHAVIEGDPVNLTLLKKQNPIIVAKSSPWKRASKSPWKRPSPWKKPTS